MESDTFYCSKLINATLLMGMLFSLASTLQANQEIALEYYKNAEEKAKANELELALELYNKAISLYSTDGEMVVEKIVDRKIISQGRTVKQVENIKIKKAPYYPNKRLKEVQDRIAEEFHASHPPELQLNWISFQDPTNDNVLDGGEVGSIAIELKNVGESAARQVKLTLKTDNTNGLDINLNPYIGELGVGKSIIRTVSVNVNKSVPNMMQQLIVQAKDKGGYQSNELEIVLPSKSHQPDKIIVAKLQIEDLNADGLIEPTEMVTVKATVANVGKGISNNLVAKLVLGENVYMAPDSNNSVLLGKIYPNGAKNIQFSFLTNHKFFQNQPLPISLLIEDQVGDEKMLSDLGLFINIPSKKVVVNVLPKNSKASLRNTNLVDVDMLVPEGNQVNENAIAVVIGNRNYRKPGLPRVEYAHNDARTMKQYLIKTMGFDEGNIFYFEDATTANFTELFGNKENHKGRVFNHIKPNLSDLFIYYSGHGAPDIKSRNSFFVPVDADPNYIALSGYSLDLFYKNMAKNAARNIVVVLDTCFSGNSDGGYLLGNISPAMVNLNKVKPQLKNSVIFSSTRVDQVSVWFHDKKHSLFTYYFLKGLTGAADKNNDLLITSSELGNYVKESVPYQARRLNGFEQDPTLIQQQEVDLVKLMDSKQNIIHTVNSF